MKRSKKIEFYSHNMDTFQSLQILDVCITPILKGISGGFCDCIVFRNQKRADSVLRNQSPDSDATIRSVHFIQFDSGHRLSITTFSAFRLSNIAFLSPNCDHKKPY